MAKLSKSDILTPTPRAHDAGEVWTTLRWLTVQVWLLYDHPNFKYCTFFVHGMELQTNGRTDRQTIRFLDVPGGSFRPGIKLIRSPIHVCTESCNCNLKNRTTRKINRQSVNQKRTIKYGFLYKLFCAVYTDAAFYHPFHWVQCRILFHWVCHTSTLHCCISAILIRDIVVQIQNSGLKNSRYKLTFINICM